MNVIGLDNVRSVSAGTYAPWRFWRPGGPAHGATTFTASSAMAPPAMPPTAISR